MPERFVQNRQEMAAKAVPTPEKAKPIKDENGVPEELWPYRDQMRQWLDGHLDELSVFLEYKHAKFNLICGMGFFYRGKDHTVSLSVPFFKSHLEKNDMTIDQIFFGAMHEMAHVKTAYEQDLAGNYNHLAQYDYEGRKTISAVDDPLKFLSLQSSYRKFYNITEDAMVNHLVLDTSLFGESVSAASRERHRQVVELYTDNFFKLFKVVGEGQGDWNDNPDPETAKDKPFINVGEGNGHYVLLIKADYDQGFNWQEAVPPLGKSGQFLTWFIKNQMIGLKKEDIGINQEDLESGEEDIYAGISTEGKMKMDKDAALALTQPLGGVYRSLLKQIIKKYENDPEQMQRYLNFMSSAIDVPVYVAKNDEVIKARDEIYANVISPNFVKNGRVSVEAAGRMYEIALAGAAKKMGLVQTFKLTYLDVFNQFKAKGRSKGFSLTLPLKLTLEERTDITRKVLETIFTMLCILDDNFDIALPPDQDPADGEGNSGQGEGGEGSGQGSEKESEQKEEEATWEAGEMVVSDDASSPNYGQKGVITYVKKDLSTGKIISVTVEYIEEEQQMAAGAMKPTGEKEEVFNPDNNLKLFIKKGQKGTGQRRNDKRKKQHEEEKEKKEGEEEKKREEGEEEDEEGEPEEGKEGEKGKKSKKGKAKPTPAKEGKGEADLGEVLNKQRKNINEIIARKEREKNLEQLAQAKKTNKYQEKVADRQKAEELLRLLKKIRAKEGLPEPSDPEFSDENMVKAFMELEKKLSKYVDQMAEAWLEIVNNIAHEIKTVRGKFYSSGKLNIKRLQKFWLPIQYGAEVDKKLIYERLIEKIQTEVKPKMLRVILLLDNSCSMQESIASENEESTSKVMAAQTCVMLLNASLRSFRVMFRDKLQEILGNSYKADMDVVCDTEIYTFGAQTRKIKSFDVPDLGFLFQPEEQFPEIDLDRETVSAILCFQKMTANEQTTLDATAWEEVIRSHSDETLKLIHDKMMTEVIFQISDGDIFDYDEAKSRLAAVRKLGLPTVGLGIGEKAVASLKKRHKNVISANTPQELVEQFGEILKTVISEQIEKPMMDFLTRANQAVEMEE